MCRVPRLPWLRSTTPSGISLGSTGLNHRQAALIRDEEGGFATSSATVGAEPTPINVSASTGANAEGGVRNAKWSAAGAPSNFRRVRRLPARYHASCVAPGATRAAPASSLTLSVYAHASPRHIRTRPSLVQTNNSSPHQARSLMSSASTRAAAPPPTGPTWNASLLRGVGDAAVV